MSFQKCHGCGGKGYVILKDKDGNEIMNKCVICNGAGVVLIPKIRTPWECPHDSNGTPAYPNVQFSANDVINWGLCDLYGANAYVQMPMR